MKKDKKKVIGEELSDDRLKMLLTLQPPKGESRDHHILLRAYRHLRSDDFARFVPFFLEAGFDLSATDDSGSTLKAIISKHSNAQPYLEVLNQASAA